MLPVQYGVWCAAQLCDHAQTTERRGGVEFGEARTLRQLLGDEGV